MIPKSTASGNTIEWCQTCHRWMVLCHVCGNNCCNGGVGAIDGHPCGDCAEAYREQDALDPETGEMREP
jgi:hypothetical protein